MLDNTNPIPPVVNVDSAGVATPAGPLLKNWSPYGTSACGDIYHDPQGRFPDGTFVITSTVVERGDGWLQTKNTRYLLGSPA